MLPYVTIVILVAGTVWRYRYHQFGRTTSSSQLYESQLLRIGSPLFHFGILVVLVGHIIGLAIPKRWTEAAGVSESAYHLQALTLGGIAGFATLAGVAILIYRRRTTGPVFMTTTRNDKAMYVVLVAAIVVGLATTLLGAGVVGEQLSYRDTLSCGSVRCSSCNRTSPPWQRPTRVGRGARAASAWLRPWAAGTARRLVWYDSVILWV